MKISSFPVPIMKFQHVAILFLFVSSLYGQVHKEVISLNGIAGYEQTDFAFPPSSFNHKIQVPGLIDLNEDGRSEEHTSELQSR